MTQDNPVYREPRFLAETIGDKDLAALLKKKKKKKKFEVRLPDLRPYISLECPDGRRGIEVGLKGTF